MRRIILAPALLLIGFPATSGGQTLGALDLAGGIGRASPDGWLRETRFAPTVRTSGAFGFLNGQATVVERQGAMRLGRSGMNGGAISPAFGVFRLALGVDVSADSAPAATLRRTEATAAITARRGRGGAWVGAVTQDRRAPGLVAGIWRTLGDAMISVQRTRRSEPYSVASIQRVQLPGQDSTFSPDSGWIFGPRYRDDTVAVSRLGSWSDLEARVDWGAARWTVSAALAGRPASDSVPGQMWGRVNAAFRVSQNVSLIASAGSIPLGPAVRQTTAGRFATLGLRLSPWAFVREPLPIAVRAPATAFTASRAADGLVQIVIRSPGARSVEIAGDFNDWTPIALRESSPGRWEASVAMRPGTHRISVRMDRDRWEAPPGVPAVEDEFNGRVGLLVIR